jgi:hypothetical protein
MADTQMVQVQTETRGAVPEGAASLAVHRVGSLLRVAPEPVLFARVKLIMSADPAAANHHSASQTLIRCGSADSCSWLPMRLRSSAAGTMPPR